MLKEISKMCETLNKNNMKKLGDITKKLWSQSLINNFFLVVRSTDVNDMDTAEKQVGSYHDEILQSNDSSGLSGAQNIEEKLTPSPVKRQASTSPDDDSPTKKQRRAGRSRWIINS